MVSRDDFIANEIFNHLQMFQFYQDLEKYEKTFVSIFKTHPLTIDENLDVSFLKSWIRREFGTQNSLALSSKNDKITKDEFAKTYDQMVPMVRLEYN